jgi:hypothetical protein
MRSIGGSKLLTILWALRQKINYKKCKKGVKVQILIIEKSHLVFTWLK